MHGKLCREVVVKKIGSSPTKFQISQFLIGPLTPEQFADLAEVLTHPEMYSGCLSMRFRKIPHEGKIFCMTPSMAEHHNFSKFHKQCPGCTRKSLGSFGSISGVPGSVFGDFMVVQLILENLVCGVFSTFFR